MRCVHHVDEEHDNQSESSKRAANDHAQLVKAQATGNILLGIYCVLAGGRRVGGAGSTLSKRMRRASNVRLIVVTASKETHRGGVL